MTGKKRGKRKKETAAERKARRQAALRKWWKKHPYGIESVQIAPGCWIAKGPPE